MVSLSLTVTVSCSKVLSSTQSKEEQKTAVEPAKPASLIESEVNTEHKDAQDSVAEEDAFILNGIEDIFIPFTDCICEYNSEDFQIYTKYFEEGNEYSSDAGTAIYMRTAGNDILIFTSNEYCIDYENGVLYLLERDRHDDFISITQYYVALAGKHSEVRGSEILSLSSLEELFAENFRLTLSDTEINFWMDSVFISALEYENGDAVLKGEAYGVYNTSGVYYQGDYYHIDWEINTATGKRKALTHEKKIYDKEKDKEIFEACDKAFTEKDGGNWIELSDLNDWKSLVDWDNIEGYRVANLWIRMDINEDNLPELIHLNGYEDWFVLPVYAIYSYIGAVMKPLDQVYLDQNDSTDFIYFGNTGNLVHESCNNGMYTNGWYKWCQFDEAWRQETILVLSYNYFWEETEYSDEEEKALLKEWFPDTYGSRGAGCYCYKSQPKTVGVNETEFVEEEITLDEFLNEYKQITGFDYFKANSYYDFIR